tara:strand:- start:634 stop:993 length:360 start_codon:yes stop_codon:yes gene_type:complete
MKIEVDNSRFMEYIDEMATQITEMNFGADTYAEISGVTVFNEEPQDYYNNIYDEYEHLINNNLGIYARTENTPPPEDKHLNLIKDIRWLTLTYKGGNIEPRDMVNQIDELLNNSYNERT